MEKSTVALLGLGSRSTLFYIKELNRLYNPKKGGYSTCPLLLLNTDFDTINPLLPNPSEQLDLVIQSYLDTIEKWDSTHLLIPNITLHETIDRVQIQKKCLHPIPLTISKLTEKNCKTIVLFGSLYSMQSDYITSHFKENDITVILPSEEDMAFIDQMRQQIYNETETEDVIKKYHELIHHYSQQHPVVLSCTELSVLKPTDCINLIDMAQVQIEKAISLL